jgi:hypothetical protein
VKKAIGARALIASFSICDELHVSEPGLVSQAVIPSVIDSTGVVNVAAARRTPSWGMRKITDAASGRGRL